MNKYRIAAKTLASFGLFWCVCAAIMSFYRVNNLMMCVYLVIGAFNLYIICQGDKNVQV
jgi:hypothetical protein